MTELTTERLRLRRIKASDFDTMRHLDTDPKVLEFLGPPFPISKTEKRMVLIEERNRKPKSLGYWMGETLEDNEPVGWFVLNNIQETKTIEIGYRLLEKAWGKGFATEGAKEILRHGFVDLALEQIVGITSLNNEGSKNVLRKIGLIENGIRYFYDQDVCYFELFRTDYQLD